MNADLRHTLFSILVGMTTVALSGWLIAGIQAFALNATVAIAWLVWAVLDYLQYERKNNE